MSRKVIAANLNFKEVVLKIQRGVSLRTISGAKSFDNAEVRTPISGFRIGSKIH